MAGLPPAIARSDLTAEFLHEVEPRRDVVHVHKDAVAVELARQTFVDPAGPRCRVVATIADEFRP
jgi:hypothetical protein